jgi:RNA polymerase sigma-70 factor (sigma-E family)
VGGKPAETIVDSQAVDAMTEHRDTAINQAAATVGFLSAPIGDSAADAVASATVHGADSLNEVSGINGSAILPAGAALDGGTTLEAALPLAGAVDAGIGLDTGIGLNLAPRLAAPSWDASDIVTEIYTNHYGQLVRLAVLLVHDLQTAEEVVQDAFEAMHLAWRRLRDSEKALSYMRQTVVNKSRSVLRHRKVVDLHQPKAAPDEPSAEHAALALIDRSAVISALRLLPGRQREAVVLRYYADLSEADIAMAMGISRGAVKSHTARAMASLKSILDQDTP